MDHDVLAERLLGRLLVNRSRYDFKYSRAALDQYRAAARRSIWPALIFVPPFLLGAFIAQDLHHKIVGLAIVVMAGLAVLWVCGLNLRAQVRAQQRFRRERQGGPETD